MIARPPAPPARRLPLAGLVIVLFSAGAGAQQTSPAASTAPAATQPAVQAAPIARLSPAITSPPTDMPLRPADLEIHNDSDRTVEAALLRLVEGGPTWRYPAAIAPQDRQTIRIQIAPLAPVQLYRLGLLRRGEACPQWLGQPLRIDWPLSGDDWVSPARDFMISGETYGRFEDFAPTWGGGKRTIFLVLAIAAIAMTATLMLGPRRRLIAFLALPAGASAVIALLLLRMPMVQQAPPLAQVPGARAMASLRSMTVTLEEPAVPVYRNRLAMLMDDAVIEPMRRLQLSLPAGTTRIVRRPGAEDLAAQME